MALKMDETLEWNKSPNIDLYENPPETNFRQIRNFNRFISCSILYFEF